MKGWEKVGKVMKSLEEFGKGGKEDLFTIYYEWCEKEPKSSPKAAQKQPKRSSKGVVEGLGVEKRGQKKSLRGVY